MPTKSLASRNYYLEAQLTGEASWAASAAFELVPPRTPGIPLGIYGLPTGTRMQVLHFLADARQHNITLDNGHYFRPNGDFFYDMAAAFGVDVAPCIHELVWPYDDPPLKGAVYLQNETGAVGKKMALLPRCHPQGLGHKPAAGGTAANSTLPCILQSPGIS